MIRLLCLAILIGGPVVAAARAADLAFRAKALNRELVQTVADIGSIEVVNAPAGADLLQLVSQQCGTANVKGYYYPIFLKANSNNPDVVSGRVTLAQAARLIFPACLRVNDGAGVVLATKNGPQWSCVRSSSAAATCERTVALRPDFLELGTTAQMSGPDLQARDLVSSITKDRLDLPAAKASYEKLIDSLFSASVTNAGVAVHDFRKILRTQEIDLLNGSINYTTLARGREIRVPRTPETLQTVKLAAGIDPNSAKQRLAEAGVYRVDEPSGVTPILPPQDHELTCGASAKDDWPFKLSELKQILDLRKALGETPRFNPILVFDSGLPKEAVELTPLRRAFFLRNPDSTEDPDDVPYIWTIVPHVYYPSGDTSAFHGLQVLSQALGGVEFLNVFSGSDAVNFTDGAVAVQMAYIRNSERDARYPWRIDNTIFVRRINNDDRMPNFIVNASLNLGISDPTVYMPTLQSNSHMLYVFAAGNEHEQLDKNPSYPAAFGGSRAYNVITVGAASPTGAPLSTSNFSKTLVDLFAPGCGLNVLSWDEGQKKFEVTQADGTSIAAPVVSFAAALIKREMTSAKSVKRRIIESGRFDPRLDNLSQSGRNLDLPVTVATQFDTMRFMKTEETGTQRNEKLVFGVFLPTPSGMKLCGEYYRDVRQATIFFGAQGERLVNMWRQPPGDGKDPLKETCQFQRGDLANLRFRQVVLENGLLSLLGPEPVEPESVRAITFHSVYSKKIDDLRFEGTN